MQKPSSKNFIRLVAALSDGEFHDGEALGKDLQLTRSAVWKMIKKLERCGIGIESVKGRGYRLCEPLVLLDEDVISRTLRMDGSDLAVFETIGSTNDYLKSKRGHNRIQFCLAEQQTSGRGRLNRAWHSPFARNIYLSCLYPFQKDISELAGLSLIISLAIVAALREFGMQDKLSVKWPNDIICDAQKLAGVLVEVQAESHCVCHAVIGIGLNVNMQDDGDEISQSWTAMAKVLNEYVDRNLVCIALIRQLTAYLARFERTGFTDFIDEWKQSDSMYGKMITLNTVNDDIRGEMAGVNAQGHILLRHENGDVRSYSSGDVSIQKTRY